VETPKQEPSNSEKTKFVSYPKPPVLQVDLKSIDKGMLATAKSIGIPLDAILQYVNDLQAYNNAIEIRVSETETKFNAIIDNFEPAVRSTIQKMVKETQTQATATPQAPTAPPSHPP